MKTNVFKTVASFMVLVFVLAACTTGRQEDMSEEQMSDSVMEDKDTEETMMTDDEKKDEMTEDEMTEDKMMEDGKNEESMMSNDGVMAPDFELEDKDGNVYRLSDIKGEKVYLKFWASWCSICLAGLSETDELFVMDKDFTAYTVVTPDANGEQSKEEFVQWFDSLGYDNIIVLFDDEGELAKQLQVRGFPTSVFIGSDGVLIQSRAGHKSNEEILEVIETFH